MHEKDCVSVLQHAKVLNMVGLSCKSGSDKNWPSPLLVDPWSNFLRKSLLAKSGVGVVLDR